MIAIVALLVVVTMSVVVTRVAAASLEATGLSPELAHFQARSAYTGVGFTTHEAEAAVANTARRKIILAMMLLGNVGIITVVASLVLGFSTSDFGQLLSRFGVLLAGLGLVGAFTRTDRFDRWTKAAFRRFAHRIAGGSIRDYHALLHVGGSYGVRELEVTEDGWLAHRSLRDLDLLHEGVIVLAVRRTDGEFIGAPGSGTDLRPGDTVIAYGHEDALPEVEERDRGEDGARQHEQAVREQQERARQREEDTADTDASGAA